jgi:cobalt-zinc-cadmium efflux system protein
MGKRISYTSIQPIKSTSIKALCNRLHKALTTEGCNVSSMESTPSDIDVEAMLQEINSVDGVRGVHDLHVWSITRNMRALSAHLVTDDLAISQGASIQTRVNEVLYHRYNVSHATLQLECGACVPNMAYCAFGELSRHR